MRKRDAQVGIVVDEVDLADRRRLSRDPRRRRLGARRRRRPAPTIRPARRRPEPGRAECRARRRRRRARRRPAAERAARAELPPLEERRLAALAASPCPRPCARALDRLVAGADRTFRRGAVSPAQARLALAVLAEEATALAHGPAAHDVLLVGPAAARQVVEVPVAAVQGEVDAAWWCGLCGGRLGCGWIEAGRGGGSDRGGGVGGGGRCGGRGCRCECREEEGDEVREGEGSRWEHDACGSGPRACCVAVAQSPWAGSGGGRAGARREAMC